MKLIRQYRDAKLHRLKNKSEEKYLKFRSYPEITEKELEEVRRVWPKMNLSKKDLTWLRVYKKEHGFSPYMVGVWQTHLIRQVLNPYAQLASFENKALCDVYFPGIPFPKAYVRRLGGVFYDSDMNLISEEDAVSILSGKDGYVIKPAFGTMKGMGVEKIQFAAGGDMKDRPGVVKGSFLKQKSDFIAQEIILQHPAIADLNPTSLNCCRVTTLYIDGRFDYSTTFKIGRKGARIDNWNSSYFCGVSHQGDLLGYGFDYELNRVTQSDSGIELKGIHLPMFMEMIHLVERAHKHFFPNCGAIGWDVVVDSANQVRVLEANLSSPAFVGEQLASGPFFEPFCDAINRRLG